MDADTRAAVGAALAAAIEPAQPGGDEAPVDGFLAVLDARGYQVARPVLGGIERVRFAPVGTPMPSGYGQRLDDRVWTPHLPIPEPDPLSVDDWLNPYRLEPPRRYDFAVVVDLVDAGAGPLRVALPNVWLRPHPDDQWGGVATFMFDPMRVAPERPMRLFRG